MTQQHFNEKWKDQHAYFDVSGESAFYFDLYVKLQGMLILASDEVLLDMLMYVEDMAQVGLCEDYGKIYRCVEDLPTILMNDLDIEDDLKEKVNNQLHLYMEKAPCGALWDWIRSSVMSDDFYTLKSVAMWFHYFHPTLKRLLCLADARYSIYSGLFEDNYAELQKWVWSDYAMNWRDKTGQTILEKLADCYFCKKETEIRDWLKGIESLSIDIYYVDKVNGTMMTLRAKSGRVFKDVECFMPIEYDWHTMCFVCMVTRYNDRWYINGPGIWHPKGSSVDKWPGTQAFLDAVDEEERDIVEDEFYKDVWGDRCSLYEDFYGEDDDEEDCEDDFLEMMEQLEDSDVWNKFKKLLSTREGAEKVAKAFNIPTKIADLGNNPHFMSRQQRRKKEGVKFPNYKYSPRGKMPANWFRKKITEVRDWTILDSTDLLYALRVYEGWMKQAHTYYSSLTYDYAHFIASDILAETVNFFDRYERKDNYKKYGSRIRKVIRDSYDLTMKTIQHDSANWREVELEYFEWLKKVHQEEPYTLFNTNAPFSIDETIAALRAMMK